MAKTTLLCTFLNETAVIESVGDLRRTYGQQIQEIELYRFTETPQNYICVFNTVTKLPTLPNTITINKKRQTTTFYTINALNTLIISLNGGILDKTYTVDWSNYEHTLILADRGAGCRFVKIEYVPVA
jgi:hypothetical protein